MVRVGLKFCGGCNPTYGRVEMADRIRRCGEGRMQWESWRDVDVIVVLNGCTKACAERELPASARVISISSDDAQPDEVVRIVLEKEGPREDRN